VVTLSHPSPKRGVQNLYLFSERFPKMQLGEHGGDSDLGEGAPVLAGSLVPGRLVEDHGRPSTRRPAAGGRHWGGHQAGGDQRPRCPSNGGSPMIPKQRGAQGIGLE
jgi:hypothetical protein